MKISQPSVRSLDDAQIRRDLLRLIAQAPASAAPPCPGCLRHVPASCSGRCADAPANLSSEPDGYPVEPKIVPLVFELAATRIMQPCWSCEGHTDPAGALWKLPQVSFYAASPLYPQLLIKHIDALIQRKALSYRWHVVLSDYGQTWETTYTLQPDLSRESGVHLGKLQHDLDILAAGLCDHLKALAQARLDALPQPVSP